MIVNTNTGKLTVNTTEKRYLTRAMEVLTGLSKHGEHELSEAAAKAIEEMEAVLAALKGEAAAV